MGLDIFQVLVSVYMFMASCLIICIVHLRNQSMWKTSRFSVFQINRSTDCCLGRFPCNSESLRTKNDWSFISWNAKQVVNCKRFLLAVQLWKTDYHNFYLLNYMYMHVLVSYKKSIQCISNFENQLTFVPNYRQITPD